MSLTVGDVLPFSVTITDSAGALANAGAVTLAVTLPDGTAASGSPFTVTPTSTGVYDKDVVSTQAGRYEGYWLATGVNAGAHTQVFNVKAATSAGIISLDEAKAHLNIPADVTTHDEELEGFIEAATEVVEGKVGPVVRRTVTEVVDVTGRGLVVLSHVPIVSLTSWAAVNTGYTAPLTADLDVDGASGILRSLSGASIGTGLMRVTYVVGRAVIPANITLAAKIIVAHLWETQRGPAAAGGFAPRPEDDFAVAGRTFSVPRRALELLEPDLALPGIA